MKKIIFLSTLIIFILFFITIDSNATDIYELPDSISIINDSLSSLEDTFTVFMQAKLFYDAQYYQEAASNYIEFIKNSPRNPLIPLALYYLGNSYENLQKRKTSIKFFEELSKNYPNNYYGIQSLKKLGDLYFVEKNFSKAKRSYWNYVYYNNPIKEKADAFFQIERCNYYLGIYNNPTEIYKNYITKFPHSYISPELNYKLANYYYNIENYSEAAVQFKKILETYPHKLAQDSIYFKLSETLYKIGDYERTIDTLIILINNFPDSELKQSAFSYLENSFLNMDNKLQAIRKLNEIIEKIPHSKRNNYYRILANLYKELGFYQQVISIYKLMLQNTKEETKRAELEQELNIIIKKTGHKNAIVDSLDSNRKSETLDLYDIYYE